MKWISHMSGAIERKFIIEEELYADLMTHKPTMHYKVYIYENSIDTNDYLLDTLEEAMAFCEEEFAVSREAWQSVNRVESVEICVPLLNEGTVTSRKTQAMPLGDELYRVLAGQNYDPEDETWEFLPGAIVKCQNTIDPWTKRPYLRAYTMQLPDGTFQISEDDRYW